MTAPTEQKGLFELLEFAKSEVRRKIICAEFEQRLADANEQIRELQHAQDTSPISMLEIRNQQLSDQLASAHQEARDQLNSAGNAIEQLDRLRETYTETFAELGRVRTLIVDHNDECERICGDKSACGYANYNRNCGNCAKDWMIER